MKRTYQENKSLYESIMRDVAKIVKGRINESVADDSSDTPQEKYEKIKNDPEKFKRFQNDRDIAFRKNNWDKFYEKYPFMKEIHGQNSENDYKNLRDLSKFGTDNSKDYIKFGYSYKISDLKNPQVQRHIIYTLLKCFPSKDKHWFGMLKRNGKENVAICVKFSNFHSGEVSNISFTAKTIYEALLML